MMNLHLKWAMTFRSPHLFCFFFLFWIYLFLFFFLKKKCDQILSQHIKVFYLSHYKAYLECSLSPLMRVLPLVSKVWSIFIFHSQMGLVLVQRVWSIGSKRFHVSILIELLVSLPMSLGFRVSKFSQNMDGSNIFSIKSMTYDLGLS